MRLLAAFACDVIYAIILYMVKTIVIDTSVIIISALIGKRAPGREVLRKCLRGEYKPLISNALFLEYEDVSKRQQIIEVCPLTEKKLLNC